MPARTAPPTYETLPPHDIAAEEGILGILMLQWDQVPVARATLAPADFFREKNRQVYEAILAVDARGTPPEPTFVARELAQGDRLEELGGASYLSLLIGNVPSTSYAEHYAALVHRLAMCRRLIQAGGRIAALGFEAGTDWPATLARAHALLDALGKAPLPSSNQPRVTHRKFD